MPVVLKCPVCGSDKLRETTSASITLVKGPAPSTINYRCDNGHYFFVTVKPAQAKDAASGE